METGHRYLAQAACASMGALLLLWLFGVVAWWCIPTTRTKWLTAFLALLSLAVCLMAGAGAGAIVIHLGGAIGYAVNAGVATDSLRAQIRSARELSRLVALVGTACGITMAGITAFLATRFHKKRACGQ